MYRECKICKRVTQHKRVDAQSKTTNFGSGLVSVGVFYICPHCNTGVSGNEVTININGNIQSSFETTLGDK